MKLKNKIAALSTFLILQTVGVNAAAIDNEIAVFAAEQDRTGEEVETFDPESLDADKNKPKTKDEIKAEEKRLEKEREEARKKIKEERKKSRDELKGKAPISKNPAPLTRSQKNNSAPTAQQNVNSVVATPAVNENLTIVKNAVSENPPVDETKETPKVEAVKPVDDVQPAQIPQNVSLPNPVISYASFNEVVQAVKFTPLYIPKKFGYSIVSIMTIDDKVAEVRYNRSWEQNVSLHVRTYRRAEGEELKDISGIHGVKWRVNAANGITTYIAKIEENKHVAAWAIGNYTFSAYVENLSFAAFHSLVADELVDLSQHYYLN